MFRGGKRISEGENEKVRKWGEEVRTRDMAPSYKDPTVQESHCLPLDWQNKSINVSGVGKEPRKITQKWHEWDLVQLRSHDKPNRET